MIYSFIGWNGCQLLHDTRVLTMRYSRSDSCPKFYMMRAYVDFIITTSDYNGHAERAWWSGHHMSCCQKGFNEDKDRNDYVSYHSTPRPVCVRAEDGRKLWSNEVGQRFKQFVHQQLTRAIFYSSASLLDSIVCTTSDLSTFCKIRTLPG